MFAKWMDTFSIMSLKWLKFLTLISLNLNFVRENDFVDTTIH